MVDLQLRTVVAGEHVEPTLPGARVGDSICMSELIGRPPLAIGFALVLIHLISIPVSNTSVNPARSTGVALFQGDWAMAQLWVFWVVPLLGGVFGGLVHRFVLATKQ